MAPQRLVDRTGKPRHKLTLRPTDATREPGWSGVASAQDTRILARQFARDVTVFRGTATLRTLYTAHNPHACLLLEPGCMSNGKGNVIAVAEGPLVSLWDQRCGEGGACVSRLAYLPYTTLHTLAQAPGRPHLLGSAGDLRGVSVWDVRAARMFQRVTSSTGDITYMSFLSSHPDHCVTGGLDQEVTCSLWDSRDKEVDGGLAAVSFRGDSRWLGLSKLPEEDALVGLCASGSLFIARFA